MALSDLLHFLEEGGIEMLKICDNPVFDLDGVWKGCKTTIEFPPNGGGQ